MTTKDKPSLGRGDVIIQLGGQEFVLKPSVNAIKTLSRKYGGLNQLVRQLSNLDFEAVCDVVEIGLGRNHSVRERAELTELIFETGLTDDTGKLGELCINYIIILMRGGRPLTQAEEEQLKAEAGQDIEGNPLSSSVS